jgi:hypothetical protein
MKRTPARWMNEKAARIVREFSDHVSGKQEGYKKQKADIEKPYYVCIRPCMRSATWRGHSLSRSRPGIARRAIARPPTRALGTTISPLERIAIIYP